MRLFVCIELLSLLVLAQQSSAFNIQEINFAVVAPKAINLNQDYYIVVTIAESEKPINFTISLNTVFSNNLFLSKDILVHPNEPEVCAFPSKNILSNIPLKSLNPTDNLIIKVTPTDFPNHSSIVTDVHIKEMNAPLVLFQTDKTQYSTGENINYQITIVDENYQPLNQITSLQIIRKSTTSPSILGEPIRINAKEQQTIFTGSFKVLALMDTISVTGNSSTGNFVEDFSIALPQLSSGWFLPQVQKIVSKNSLRVHMEFSRKLISLNEPNVTVTLILMDEDDETFLGGTCVLILSNPFNWNSSREFPISLNPKTGEGQINIDPIKELDIKSDPFFLEISKTSIEFSSCCEESILKRTSEKMHKRIEVLENIYHVDLIWNEISPSDNDGSVVMSLWFGLMRMDLRPVEMSHEEFLKALAVDLNLESQNGKLTLSNATKKKVFTNYFPPGKTLNVEFLLSNFTKFGSDDSGSTTFQGVQRTFSFFGKYKYSRMETNPSFKVTLTNPGRNVERGRNATFHLQSQFLPSLGNSFTFYTVLHSNQNIIAQEVIHFNSKFNSSRFQLLNETFNVFIPYNITNPNLFLTVYGLFESPGEMNVEKVFYSSTTNVYVSSPAVLYQMTTTDNMQTMLREINFDLRGSIENITEVAWTITKLGVDERSPIEKFEDEFVRKEASLVVFRKSDSFTITQDYNKKVTFPMHVLMNDTMQYRLFHNFKNIQPYETICFSKSFDKFTEHGEYLISAMTVYNGTSSSSPGLHFTNQIRFTVPPPPLTLHMTAPERVIVGQPFQVQTTVKNPTDELYEGNVTLDYYYEEQNKTSLSEHVKLDGNSWVNIIFPITTYDDSTLVLDFQSNISPSLTVQKLVTVRYPEDEENNIVEGMGQGRPSRVEEVMKILPKFQSQ